MDNSDMVSLEYETFPSYQRYNFNRGRKCFIFTPCSMSRTYDITDKIYD